MPVLTFKPNEFGVYDNEYAEVLSARNNKCTVDIYLLQIERGWLSAVTSRSSEQGHSCPLTPRHGIHATQKEAFENAIKKTLSLRYISKTLIDKLQQKYEQSRQIDLF